MQPPTNFDAMPEFYSGTDHPAAGIGENAGRPRRRSSSAPREKGDFDGQQQQQQQQYGPLAGNLQTDIAKMAWEAGSNQVKRAFFLYTNIDLFRPYFDVEPKQLRNRLFQSLLPRKPASMQSMGADLYGPLMLIFTLVAILLFSMKSSGYQAKDGTLIGTAFFTCFAYWFFASTGVYSLGYVFVSRIGMLQTFSILGYALFSHCLVLGISDLAHHFADSHAAFYILFGIFGGLSSLRMAIYFMSKTPAKTHKLIMASVVVALHLGFLLYLHFGYHRVVEEISEMLGDENIAPVPAAPADLAQSQAALPQMPAVQPDAVKKIVETVTVAIKESIGKVVTMAPLGDIKPAVSVAPAVSVSS